MVQVAEGQTGHALPKEMHLEFHSSCTREGKFHHSVIQVLKPADLERLQSKCFFITWNGEEERQKKTQGNVLQ